MFEDSKRVVPAEVFPDLAAAIAAVADEPGTCSGIRAGVELRALVMLVRALMAVLLRRVDCFHRQGHAAAWGQGSTSSFLRGYAGMGGHAQQLVAAAMLARKMPALGNALAQGKAGLEHLTAVAGSTRHLPDEQLAKADRRFTAKACQGQSPRELRAYGDRLTETWRAAQCNQPEPAGAQKVADLRYLHTVTTLYGMTHLEAMLTPEAGAKLQAALEPLTDPHGEEDHRSGGQRHADAFEEVLEIALRSGQLPDCGGDRPRLTLVVTVEQDPDSTPATGPGCDRGCDGDTDHGKQVGPGRWETQTVLLGELIGHQLEVTRAALQRLGCDADRDLMLMGTDGMPLWLGRTRRDTTVYQRRALVVRDKGCVFPGCQRRPQWCHAHHLKWWARDNGPTDVPNLALLCSFHHHLVHDGWTLQLIPPDDPERPPDFTGLAWQATSPDGELVLRNWRERAA
jgi:hypothetical protein